MISSLVSGITLINLGILFIYTFLASLGLPGDTFWIIYAAAFANNFGQLMPIMAITAAAAILGDIAAYELAKKFSLVLPKKLVRFDFFKNGEARARKLFKKFEFSLIFFSRFAFTALGAPVSYISGFEKLDRKKFLAAVISGEIIYASIYSTMGFMFKETWNDLASVIGGVLAILVLMILVIFLIVMIDGFKRRKKSAENFINL